MNTSIIWQPPRNKAEWLEQRESYSRSPLDGRVTPESIRFGGSSMATIMGINPNEGRGTMYKRCIDLMDGIRVKNQTNEAMVLGERYEPGGRVLVRSAYPDLEVLADTTRPFLDRFIVSVDGLLADAKTGHIVAVLEIKTKYRATCSEIREEITRWKGGVPIYYAPQLELYCRAYDLPHALLVIQTPTDAPEYYRACDFHEPVTSEFVDRVATICLYHRSDAVWERMQQAEREFRECLRTRTKPGRQGGNANTRQAALDDAYFTDLRSKGVFADPSPTGCESGQVAETKPAPG